MDGTLADSTTLGFTSTNAVLVEAGLPTIDLAQYKRGTRFPTPERMAWHATGAPSDPVGARLGARFDEHYVRLVDTDTAGFYAGIRDVVEALHERKNGAQAVLSNACGAYARASCTFTRQTRCAERMHAWQDLCVCCYRW